MANRSEIDDAIATLAQQLRGAVEVAVLGGIAHLPRPRFAAAPAVASLTVAPAIAVPPTIAPVAPRLTLTVASPGEDASTEIAAPPLPLTAGTPRSPLPVMQSSETQEGIARVMASSAPPGERLATLRDEVIGECVRCKLHRGRSKLVFGVGNPTAELVFVGEGPGIEEDRQGIPFVGRAGMLLTKMIEAMGKHRDDVYICNVVKCRPPNNRDPEPDEVEACEGFLQAQLAIVKPRVIVALGRYAAQTLLRTKTPITKLRGTWQTYDLGTVGAAGLAQPSSIDVMPTYHPSYLLREESDPNKTRKREAWSDLQRVMKALAPAP